MVTGELSSHILCYQQYVCGQQPLILALQNETMKHATESYGRNMVFIDATGQTNMYGFPLWTLLVMDYHGKGLPVGYIIASKETEALLTVALHRFRSSWKFCPRLVFHFIFKCFR